MEGLAFVVRFCSFAYLFIASSASSSGFLFPTALRRGRQKGVFGVFGTHSSLPSSHSQHTYRGGRGWAMKVHTRFSASGHAQVSSFTSNVLQSESLLSLFFSHIARPCSSE